MPRAKKSHKTKQIPTRKVSAASVLESEEISFETQLVIVILLLIFVYPIGLIFMWWWMRSWPLWLKILLSLPFILGIVAFLGILGLVSTFFHNGYYMGPSQPMRPPTNQRHMLIPSTSLPSGIPTDSPSYQTY